MQTQTIHNPDRYMADLRQILSQGRKRIGILLGAGAPTAILIDGQPLIPDVAGLTSVVIKSLDANDKNIIQTLVTELGSNPNIEAILTRIRKLEQAIGKERLHGLDSDGYKNLGQRICEKIGSRVNVSLPPQGNPYTELVSWIGGTHRDHPVEIFTPNYDLLIEEAFERARLPYFDGFSGSRFPFFDPVSISSTDALPTRWSRLWKLHGSLGWDVKDGAVVRTGQGTATKLIYPDHLKYDEITRLPYSALFDRLRHFLMIPDSLLLCTGFSFFDSHICAVLDEALGGNPHTAVFAFQYRNLEKEGLATNLAFNRRNLSVYGRDAAVISGVKGQWQPGIANEEWKEIRQTFWQSSTKEAPAEFLLGDFAKLAGFFALAQAQQMRSTPNDVQHESVIETFAPGEAKNAGS